MRHESTGIAKSVKPSFMTVAVAESEEWAEQKVRRHPMVLLVEDDSSEARLTMFALRETGVEHRVEWASSVTEARRKLFGQTGRWTRPDLILLDYYLPDAKSTQFLEDLKSDANLRRIPVVMLTSSEVAGDVFRAYDHHANGYVVKPSGLEGYLKVMRSIADFWLDTANLVNI